MSDVPHPDPYTAVDTVDAYAEGYDDGQSAIWTAIVCSICGRNHDADESAACEESEPMSFADWVASIHEQRLLPASGLALIQDADRWMKAYMRERERLFNLRRAIRLSEAHMPNKPEVAMQVIERAYGADEEIEQQLQQAATLPKVAQVEASDEGSA